MPPSCHHRAFGHKAAPPAGPTNALLAGHKSKDRIIRDEAIFRAINERVEEVQSGTSPVTDFVFQVAILPTCHSA